MSRTPLIIGAGPAGLTAALELTGRGVTPQIFEATGAVGGLARTPTDGQWRIDPGGHRFFTKSEAVSDLWRSLLPDDQWIAVPRSSAMLVDGHLVGYPLRGRDLVTQMGIWRGMRGLGSLAWSRARRTTRLTDQPANFRAWGTEEFGRYWYRMFFDGYVRKTWLTEPAELSSDWALQRIKPIAWRRRNEWVKQDVFRYPRRGPGQLWEAAAERLAQSGVVTSLNSRVEHLRYDGRTWVMQLADGHTVTGDAVFSSMPLGALVHVLDPQPPSYLRSAAASLKHRSLITVAVALSKPYDIPYNWVYTPGPGVHAGRIQNYRRWSEGLAPDGWDGTFLGFEYFIGPGSPRWGASDEQLTALATEDLQTLDLDPSTIEKIMFVRSRFAYPIHDPTRDRSVVRIRDYLREHYPSLHPMGRNGMHRYDNQDHAMLSAMHSVGRYFGEQVTDPWHVNTERQYHETGLQN
ncbi:NAD(P)/FAD-dependent oxidoreductase [Mycobacterium sp. SMC-4]|uniref:NAD(P)/FAD-dependent oxidoreductase n=1 Tax=Mycobacterium sp. SMC-4 TaxID=2857059 RepID=UPI0021B44265|nr:NAD(P)/FAD-dependent oxidoreductase [Mycobacterium sp. SMC-4]UXA19299.1 NAD(P)/FAD-dependent oxidoreductase [Mycobacterium sp. SMC-4]